MKNCYFLFLFLLIGCQDDEPFISVAPILQLPAATMTGENTFGCLINGEPWVAMTSNSSENDLDIIFDETTFFLSLQATRFNESQDDYFSLAVSNVVDTGRFQILDKDIFAPLQIYTDFNSSEIYYLDTNAVRSFTVNRLDLNNNVISGTFEFTLLEKDSNDTLKITEGRMDAIYRN